MLAAACGTSTNDDRAAPPTTTTAPADSAATASTGDLTLALLKVLPGDNIVLGPHTIDMVLSMALAGARGKTAEELKALLGHDVPESVIGSRESDGMILDLAARFWMDQTFEPHAEYHQKLESAFKAAPRTVDFQKAPDKAVDAINADVSKTTRGKIPKLLAKLDRTTRMVLVSAAYMNADWESPFDADRTSDDNFALANGVPLKIPTMHQTATFAHGAGPGWKSIQLPYKDKRTSMLVIVPDDLKAFQKSLDKAGLAAIDAALKANEVILSMPKFETRTKTSLVDTLTALGAGTMFTEAADFSGIADPAVEPLVVSEVQHEAWVKVDEKGTEAAAATAAMMTASAAFPAPERFDVDRPFLFLIRDSQSGAVLFTGRIFDPR
jgi:serpin B